jgi:hypothetical protein
MSPGWTNVGHPPAPPRACEERAPPIEEEAVPRGGERESFAKRQRERARMEKAEAKRQRRFDRKSGAGEPETAGEPYEPADGLEDRPDQPDAPQESAGDGPVE